MIDPKDVKSLVEDLMKEAKKKFPNYKMRVRGLNALQWFTLKGFDQDNLNVDEIDEYLDGRVSDDSKFGNFFQLEISIVKWYKDKKIRN